MKVLKVINKETGKADAFDMNYVESYTSPEAIEKMRKCTDHALFSMVVCFKKEMPTRIVMYGVDDFDMFVEG